MPHNMLKSLIATLIQISFQRRDGSNRTTHIKITGRNGYFIDTINPGEGNLYTVDHICRMAVFLIDNINPTQYAEVSKCYTCTQRFEEERWK